ANGHFQDIIESLEVTKTYAQSDQLYQNNGNGTFTDISSLFPDSYFSERHVGRATATGDYDNDGDIDIFVVNSNQEAILLRNEGGNHNNWIQIKLVGRQSNRDGIQARVQISCDGVKQMREVKSGSCYASGSDKRLLFGLGKKNRIDFVQVNWPSGIVQTLENVEVNQFLTITESE
ncbi:TPA: CRTAC1 family protein, partial [Candidatus Poribacteria bacterium]|nr:CRTAC1 family protein [Candidatus Poribacteria bacterium]